MHPDFQLFPIDDPKLFPVYETLQGRAPIVLHMGDPRYDYSHPKRLRRVLELFPNLEVIAAHFGGYSMPETAYQELKNKHCYFDISSSLMFMEDGIAEHYIRTYGAERFVFGSDFPLWDPRIEVKKFLQLRLTPDEIEQIVQNSLDREVSTAHIGDLVMDRLKPLDEVAYVRFASVYRQFKDINTFMNELSKLLSEK